MKVLHIFLRPLFASGLFLAQFSSARTTWFTDNPYLVMGGAVLVAIAIALLTRAANKNQIAQSGPNRTIRHPVYVSIYLLSFGLGLMFFAWLCGGLHPPVVSGMPPGRARDAWYVWYSLCQVPGENQNVYSRGDLMAVSGRQWIGLKKGEATLTRHSCRVYPEASNVKPHTHLP